MTIIQAVMSGAEVCLLADCRLSPIDARGNPIAYRPGAILACDVCQKLVVADGRAVVGFAGDLCLARDLLRGVVNRIRQDPDGAAAWLRSDETYHIDRKSDIGASRTQNLRLSAGEHWLTPPDRSWQGRARATRRPAG